MIITIVVLLTCLGLVFKHASNQDQEIRRIKTNFNSLQNDSMQVLTLTRAELRNQISVKTKLGRQIDSLLRATHTAKREVKEVTITKVIYRDSCDVQANVVNVSKKVIEKDSLYVISVESDGSCIKIRGDIRTKDKDSQLIITDKQYAGTINLIVKQHRRWFLGRKKTYYKATSDCGVVGIQRVIVE